MSSNRQDIEADRRAGISGAPMVVAILAILVWVGFLIVMLRAADADETQWARMTYVFASVEAIAFAAAGALFGVNVQRGRVKSAEEKAEANARDAANGRALAITTIADERPAASPQGAIAFGPGDAPEDVRQRHAALARHLFPDLE